MATGLDFCFVNYCFFNKKLRVVVVVIVLLGKLYSDLFLVAATAAATAAVAVVAVAAGTVAAGQGRFELGEPFGRQQVRLVVRYVVPRTLRHVVVALLQRPDALLFQPHSGLDQFE